MTTAVVETAAPIDATNPAQVNPAAAAAIAAANPVVADPVIVTPPVAVEAPVIGEAETPPVVDPDAPTSADAVDGIVTYQPTGDAGMDMALEFAGNLGLGMDHPAMVATITGDWSLLEAHLATLGDKAAGWERMMQLAKDADGRLTATRDQAANDINTAVSGVLGESQADVLAWAGTTASADEKSAINEMLRAGPVQARAAALMLADLYAKASGTTVTPSTAMREGSGSTPAAGDTSPLNNRQFASECAKLVGQYGSENYQNTTEYVALTRRLGK